MAYVLGVDGGASKTHALIADERGRLLGFGQAGGSNYESVGLPAAKQAVAAASLAAIEQAGLDATQVEAACFSLAGADFPEDFAMLEQAMGELRLAGRFVITNDSIAALRSGTQRPYGVVVIMGSGMNAAALDVSGREYRLPAEGYLYGDWGGAGSIGAEVMHRIFRAHDGRGQPTVLTSMTLQFLGVPSMEELTRRLYRGQLPEERIPELAPLVFEAAYEGDAVACEIVSRIGQEAAAAAIAMMRRAGLDKREVDVVLGGSIFRGKGPLLMDVIGAGVHAVNPLARLVVPAWQPVVGAVIIAIELAGAQADAGVWANIRETYERTAGTAKGAADLD